MIFRNACLTILLAFILLPVLFAQESTQKYALVIGNGAYTGLSRLANPVNDANDIAIVLEHLGFHVDVLLDASLEEMENAVFRFRDNLSVTRDSYGFLFYAGHGVQSGGENYLIPVDAAIPTEAFLRTRALSVQAVMTELSEAGNILNVVVLDACRDNPFGWSRAGSRGLAMIHSQPAGSIVVYATSAGQVASDGTGRNGLFTSHFLNNLVDSRLEINEVLRRTGADVSSASGMSQIPAIYSQFFGTAFLGGTPDSTVLEGDSRIQLILGGNVPQQRGRRLMAGVRSGVSPQFWTLSDEFEAKADSPSIVFEPALQAAFYFTDMFGLQTEIALSFDTLLYSGIELGYGEFSASFESYSLRLPLLACVTLRPGNFLFSALAGVSFNIPLGAMKLHSSLYDDFSYRFSIPPGYIIGANAGMKIGAGFLFSDIRFSGDLAKTVIHDNYGTLALYTRNTLSFSLGYKFEFFLNFR